MARLYHRGVPDEPPRVALHRWAFILTLWAEPHWRGCLETADGQRRYFHTLSELLMLITGLSGWAEPSAGPTTSMEGDPK